MRVFIFIILFGGMSCARQAAQGVSMFPPQQFSQKDLIGVWEVSNAEYSFESLELRDDNTFSQSFNLIDSDYVYETTGTWEIVVDDTGCLYVDLQGMMFFYQVLDIAENGNMWDDGSPEYYWDSCAEKPIQMVNKTILSIGSHPDSKNGVVLWHMSSQRHAINMIFEYQGKHIP